MTKGIPLTEEEVQEAEKAMSSIPDEMEGGDERD